jgi:MFS superfamily sulfate permease-like transporter
MNPGVLIILVVFLAVGCMLGWHAQRAKAAHGDVRSTKGRLPGFRKERIRSGLYSLVLIAIVVLILAALVRH